MKEETLAEEGGAQMTRRPARPWLPIAATLLFCSTFPAPAPAADFPAGTDPTSVAVGDFDGDGRLDLAVANNGSDDVSVLLGNGDGTFRPAVSYPVGDFPWSVAVGDFDGDGKLDLAVANAGSHTISVLLGKGHGKFKAAPDVSAGLGPVFVAVDDVNGDGKPDLVVASLFSSTSIAVVLGNGDGTFQAPLNFAAGSGSRSVAVGDFNGDGKRDLAVANFDSENVSVLLGNGNGTFQAPLNFAAGRNPSSVATGDFNGDGRLDLAVANFDIFNADVGGDDVSVLLGKGDGTFFAAASAPAGSGPLSWVHSVSVAVGRINGDQALDLAVVNQDNSVSVLRGNGDGTFGVAGTFLAHFHPTSVAVGDFNGDHLPDLAVTNFDSRDVSVLLGNVDGSVQAASGPTTFSVILGGMGTGTVTSSESPARISCWPNCSTSYLFGATVTLTATPSAGSTFTGWQVIGAAGCAGTGPCTVTITGTTFVFATFVPDQGFALTVSRAGTGGGLVRASSGGIDCGATCSVIYPSGAVVKLKAAADLGSTFVGWSGCDTVSDRKCFVTMNAARSVTATFALVPRFTLTVAKAGTDNDRVVSSPGGINCGATCSAAYESGTVVRLMAVPATGATFIGWTGCDTVSDMTCAVTLNAARSVTATFQGP
jgi:hypothetical protein